MLNGEVGDTDGADLGLGQLGHGLPGLDNGHILVELHLGAVFGLGEEVGAGGKGDGPVDEIELRMESASLVFSILFFQLGNTHVEVVEAKLGQGVVESRLDVLGPVGVVPQLGGDEDVFALQAGDLSEGLLDALADLLLVAVDLGKIEVAVANLEGLEDAGADFARGSLPGAVAELGDLVAGVEGDGLSGRHVCGDAEEWGRVLVDWFVNRVLS